jgi:hypothetical protein
MITNTVFFFEFDIFGVSFGDMLSPDVSLRKFVNVHV